MTSAASQQHAAVEDQQAPRLDALPAEPDAKGAAPSDPPFSAAPTPIAEATAVSQIQPRRASVVAPEALARSEIAPVASSQMPTASEADVNLSRLTGSSEEAVEHASVLSVAQVAVAPRANGATELAEVKPLTPPSAVAMANKSTVLEPPAVAHTRASRTAGTLPPWTATGGTPPRPKQTRYWALSGTAGLLVMLAVLVVSIPFPAIWAASITATPQTTMPASAASSPIAAEEATRPSTTTAVGAAPVATSTPGPAVETAPATTMLSTTTTVADACNAQRTAQAPSGSAAEHLERGLAALGAAQYDQAISEFSWSIELDNFSFERPPGVPDNAEYRATVADQSGNVGGTETTSPPVSFQRPASTSTATPRPAAPAASQSAAPAPPTATSATLGNVVVASPTSGANQQVSPAGGAAPAQQDEPAPAQPTQPRGVLPQSGWDDRFVLSLLFVAALFLAAAGWILQLQRRKRHE